MTKASPERVTRIRTNPKPKVAKGHVRQRQHQPAHDPATGSMARTDPPSFAAQADEPIAKQLEIKNGIARIVMVGPRGAAALQACRYEKQRPLIERHAQMLTAAILKGQWVPNGDPIIISVNGKVMNGQNRLEAVRRAKLAVQFVVIEGMDEAAFENIDRPGRGRSVAFRLGIPQRMASDVALLHAAKNGSRSGGQNGDLRIIEVWWRPIYRALASVIPASGKQAHNNGHFRIAVGLRWAIANSHEDRAYILQQYSAITRGDTGYMSCSVHALMNEAIHGKPTWVGQINHQETMRRAAIVFARLDPQRRDDKSKRVQPDVEALVRWITAAEAAYKAERVADVHPFRFGDAPVIDIELRGPEKVRSSRVRRDDAPEHRPQA